MPRGRLPRRTVATTRAEPKSITLRSPERSFVTKSRGPAATEAGLPAGLLSATGGGAGGAEQARSGPSATTSQPCRSPATGATPFRLLQREREERIARADHDVLLAFEHERLRPVAGVRPEPRVPQPPAGRHVEGH